MKKILLIFSFFMPVAASAQVAYGGPPAAMSANPTGVGNSYDINVQTNNPPIFTYTTVDELLQPKVVVNAFEIRFKPSPHENTRIFAQVDFANKRRSVPDGWLSLKLLNTTSATALTDNNAVALSQYPILLITQAPVPGNNTYSFVYNVILNPLAKHVRPDNYNFNVKFTMTRP
jgi:hypothetical protein